MKISLLNIRLTPNLRICLVVISILMTYLSYPSGFFPALAVFALIPVFLSLKNAGIKEGFLIGLLFGFLFYFTIGNSLVTAFSAIHNFGLAKSLLLTILAAIIHSAPYPVFGLLCGYYNEKKKPLGPLRGAVYLTVLQTVLAGTFPITPVHALYKYPVSFQILDIGGLPLLLFVYNMAGLLTAEIILPSRGKSGKKLSIIMLAAIIITIAAYGKIRIDRLNDLAREAGPGHIINIVSIQPDIPIEAHYRSPEDNLYHIKDLIKLSGEAIGKYPGQELIVWPELPFDFSCNTENPYQKIIRDMLIKNKLRLSYICDEDVSTGVNPGFHNTAAYISDKGTSETRYYKQILVPFGEYLPYEDKIPALRNFFPMARHYVHGDKSILFNLSEGKRIIPTICYEIIYSGQIKKFAETGGNIILNMSDDAWFGKTTAPLLHLSMGIFRAVEYRMPLVRITNSGNGCFVQPTGEIVKGSLTPVDRKCITSFPLFIPKEQTIFLKYGSYFKWFFIVFSAFDAILSIIFIQKSNFN